MSIWSDYHLPASVDEALALLAQYKGNARIIAGGTDLLVDAKAEEEPETYQALIDITRIPELRAIKKEEDAVILGAAVTHTEVIHSDLLEAEATCLVESCGVIGGPQVRNVATLGGNVAHALPAGDGTISLVALGAEGLVAWSDGIREWLPVTQLFKGPGLSALNSARDLLVAFRFPVIAANEGTAFKRIMRPQGVALPILGCAVRVRLNDAHTQYEQVQICIAPAAPTPVRAIAVEEAIQGQAVSEETINRAVAAAHESIHPRTSKYRASADYRSEMIDVLLRHTLPLATERAKTGFAQAEGVGLG